MPPSLCIELGADEQYSLLDIARRSISSGLESGRALQIDASLLGDKLRAEAAVFVTLTRGGALRGCVGSMQAVESLAQAVAHAAFNAAFRDRRFDRVETAELDDLRIEVSVLSQLEPIEADSRQALLDALQPGVDGLLMEDGGYRSTFLPKVWEKIPSGQQFLEELMQKAGLPAGHWSDTIHFYRYHTLSFAEN
jgi:AmmeMemoRadiSam system protein A